jgi:hypothetical protein
LVVSVRHQRGSHARIRLALLPFSDLIRRGRLAAAGGSVGQAYFGTVSGDLTDPTGVVVRLAKVVLTDQQKGFTFERLRTATASTCSAPLGWAFILTEF